MARNNRESKNNNPTGRNQYSGGVMEMARDRPMAAAAVTAAAVGAGVFLWSRRNQISEQLTNISDQIGQWSESMSARGQFDQFDSADAAAELSTSAGSSTPTGSKSRSSSSSAGDIGGSASIGGQSGGSPRNRV